MKKKILTILLLKCCDQALRPDPIEQKYGLKHVELTINELLDMELDDKDIILYLDLLVALFLKIKNV